MLRLDNVNLRRGSRLLLNDANFIVHPSWRVGLTGRNGSGKSSLLALIAGEVTPDAGTFSRPRDWLLAHVRQQAEVPRHSAIDHVLDGDQNASAGRANLNQLSLAGDSADFVGPAVLEFVVIRLGRGNLDLEHYPLHLGIEMLARRLRPVKTRGVVPGGNQGQS